jgi:nicotinate phosphoribosyltransferase
MKESIRVACALGKDLLGVRLDTPSERGGVISDLVKEVRARLNQAGFPMVKIFVSAVSPQKK